MALTSQERAEVWALMMRRRHCPSAVMKTDFRAAINAADDWADANATSYNNALPLPFRTAATNAEKALLLAFVCLKRAGLTLGG